MRRVVAFSALCLAAMPASAAPLVTSDSNCPSTADVIARLTGLWSGDNPDSVTAHIRVEGGHMVVELVSEGEPAASRILPVEPDCESRVQAAALVIAAWLDSMPADPLGQVESVAALSVESQVGRVGSPPAPPAADHRGRAWEPSQGSHVESPPPLEQSRFSLGLGVFASLDARGAGAALSGEAAWARVVGRFGLAATLCSPLPRDTSVGGGTALWWRPVLALVLRAPLTQGAWLLDAGAGPVFGLLLVSGSGFRPNHTEVAASWGAFAGLRLAYKRSHAWAYWAELRALLWPAAQNIRVIGPGSSSAALPRIEGQFGLGFSFGAF